MDWHRLLAVAAMARASRVVGILVEVAMVQAAKVWVAGARSA